MNDFGSTITIDNKNLLDDLLGLGGSTNTNASGLVGGATHPTASNRLLFNGGSNATASNMMMSHHDDDMDTAEYFFSKRGLNRYGAGNTSYLNGAGAGTSYLSQQPVHPVNRFYLESPTFTKAEDDIYRYVHSRLSNADLATSRITEPPMPVHDERPPPQKPTNNHHEDMRDSPMGEEKKTVPSTTAAAATNGVDSNNYNHHHHSSSSSSSSASKHNQLPQQPPPPIQQRIGSNRLLSDLAVASLPPPANIIKRDPLIYSNHTAQTRLGKTSLEDQLLFDTGATTTSAHQDLLDSLDLNSNNNNHHRFGSNPTLLQHHRHVSPSILDNQYHHQQQQQHQQHQSQQAPFHLPVQTLPAQGGIFVLPSPTGAPNGAATAIQAQFIPVPVPITTAAGPPQAQQAQPQANMFYNHHHHGGDMSTAAALPQPPIFYNTAYPIAAYPTAAASYDPATAAAYFSPPPHMYSNPGAAVVMPKSNQQHQQQQFYNAQSLQQPQSHHAQSLPPQPTPRAMNRQHQQQQKQAYYDDDDEDSDAENDLNNEFNMLSVYDKNGGPKKHQQHQQHQQQQPQQQHQQTQSHQSRMQHHKHQQTRGPQDEENEQIGNGGGGDDENDDDEESKSQQVWQKLQRAAAATKNSGANKKRTPGFGSSNSNHSINNKMNGSNSNLINRKPPLPDRRAAGAVGSQQQTPAASSEPPSTNYIDKNIEALRNKENLSHRYPEKKYELVHNKNLGKNNQATSSTKKPPHHLQPLENNHNGYETDPDADFNPYETKKISIPLDAKSLKDKDHINVDINLRLIDFMAAAGNHHNNRSMDDEMDDPLARYIRHYENTMMSRSLPGSSGGSTFPGGGGGKNRHPLPPLGGQQYGSGGKFYPMHKPYSHEEARRLLQHEYENEAKSEDGYLAQLQKSHIKKPPIKTYTIKDYRNFKKDAPPVTNASTGKLGFDYDNDMYKKKIEKVQKLTDYAERVKTRNRIILTDQQQKRNDDNDSTPSQQQQVPPSKTQRAKEYVNNTIFRVRSASQPSVRKSPTVQEKTNGKPTVTVAAAYEKKRSSQSSEPTEMPKKQDKQQQLDLNPRHQQKTSTDNTAMVRIRDPVTSKVRTIYLNDSQIEELAVRHEMEKSKVSTIKINSGNNGATANPPQPMLVSSSRPGHPNNNLGLLKKGRQPLNLSSSRDLLALDDPPPTTTTRESAAATPSNNQPSHTETEAKKSYPYTDIDEKPTHQEHVEKKEDDNDHDDHMSKLIERHLSEKKKVVEFDDHHENNSTTNITNNNNQHSIEVE